MERVMVFIDGNNVYHGLKRLGQGTWVDVYGLACLLSGADRRVVRVHYYNSLPDQTEDPDRYRKAMQYIERARRTSYVRVSLGRLELRPGGVHVEKGVDVNIAVDMLTNAVNDNYDTAILVSGDGDFADVLIAVGDLGKSVENAYFGSGRSRHLSNACDVFTEITDQMVRQCLLPPP